MATSPAISAALEATLARLPGRHGAKRLAEWRALARDGAFEALADTLIETHYDPAYERSRRADSRPSLGVIEMKHLDPRQPGRRPRSQILGLLGDGDVTP